jgi:hypothetical protein
MAVPNKFGQEPGVRGQATRNIEAAVSAAKRTGYVVGRKVRIGVVTGVIVGYNIARCGDFEGSRYPLLVQTEYGIAKCALMELQPN